MLLKVPGAISSVILCAAIVTNPFFTGVYIAYDFLSASPYTNRRFRRL